MVATAEIRRQLLIIDENSSTWTAGEITNLTNMVNNSKVTSVTELCELFPPESTIMKDAPYVQVRREGKNFVGRNISVKKCNKFQH